MPHDLAIDLGTANTLVYEKAHGVCINEPTVIALNSRTNQVLAIGREAWNMIGRTPGHIVAVRPLRHGAISDFDVTERFVRIVLARAGVSRKGFGRPRVLVCVPSSITEVEKRAVEEATVRAGAKAAFMIDQPMAAAIGAALPVHAPVGSMVVDIGGGTTEVAVISLGGIVSQVALRVGSFDFDAAIQAFVKREFGVAIGERTSEEIKIAIGGAGPSPETRRAEVRGRDLMTALPRTVVITSDEVSECIAELVDQIVVAVVSCLSDAPPELAQDILSTGIHLTGGGALLKGLDAHLVAATHLPVHIAPDPLEAVVLGAGQALESFDLLKDVFA